MRRAAWFAFAAALSFGPPASAQQAYDADGQRSCYTSESADKCAETHFKDLKALVLDEWRKRFERGTWVQETNCQKVRTALFDLFEKTESAVSGKTAKMYFALPKDNDADWMGSYWGNLSDST
ncbi:MAG: hypothetical protein F4139_00760 [Gemmatimonadetes bacterium]|nr:hypothetical protein [Gemmatimonadota bacterium]MYB99523.1 hypothetical protein [Gemmatimonadota bacterium]MYH51459.1 hypothetical protein [Gemmatimonadota bacterium]